MSAEDIAKILHLNPSVTSEEVAKLITELQGFRDPIDEDFSIEFGIQSDETRLRSETHTVGRDITKSENRTRDLTGGVGTTTMMRSVADPLNFYPLIHTENSFSGITFPANNTKKGGRIDADGTGYITITDQTRLNPTTELSIVGFMYIPSAVTVASDEIIVEKGTAQYALLLTSKTNMRLRIVRGAGTVTFNATVPNDAWFSFAFSYDTTNGFQAFIDKVRTTSGATGNIVVTATSLGVMATPAGTELLENTIRLSWVTMLSGEVTQAWVDNWHDSHLNTDPGATPAGFTEILTIPFTGDTKPQPESSFGIAKVT